MCVSFINCTLYLICYIVFIIKFSYKMNMWVLYSTYTYFSKMLKNYSLDFFESHTHIYIYMHIQICRLIFYIIPQTS